MLDGGSFPPASPIPACLSECPLPYQQHASASLSFSLSLSRSPTAAVACQRPASPLCPRRDPAWLPWRPGVTHRKLRPGCNRTHVALLCLTCTLVFVVLLRLILFFPLFQMLSNIGGILCESALNEKADECMQTGSPDPRLMTGCLRVENTASI